MNATNPAINLLKKISLHLGDWDQETLTTLAFDAGYSGRKSLELGTVLMNLDPNGDLLRTAAIQLIA